MYIFLTNLDCETEILFEVIELLPILLIVLLASQAELLEEE